MIEQITERWFAALHTYLTRRVAMAVIAVVSLMVFIFLCIVGSSSPSGANPMFAANLIGMPSMAIVFFLVQQAKWQFVHPRAKLMPRFAPAHLSILGGLLLLSVGVYPIVASQLLGVSTLGIASFSALSGALLAWGMHSMRQSFMFTAMALFYSLLIPKFSWIWIEPTPELVSIHFAAIPAGWAGIGLWLRRLSKITEEDNDYMIPIQAQFGQASRMEKSEARRTVARMLSRAKLMGWITDRWHDRLAQITPQSNSERRSLLRYGMAPTPAIVRSLFFMSLMLGIAAMTTAMLVDQGPHKYSGGIMQCLVFTLVGPMMTSQFLAMRRARLSHELLLPMTRQTLVDGLLRVVVIEGLQITCVSCATVVVLATWLAPELLTPIRITTTSLAILSIQPLLIGAGFRTGLITSGMKRMIIMILILYAAAGAAAGVYALSTNIWLGYGAISSLCLVTIGWKVIQAARKKWMNAELG